MGRSIVRSKKKKVSCNQRLKSSKIIQLDTSVFDKSGGTSLSFVPNNLKALQVFPLQKKNRTHIDLDEHKPRFLEGS